VDLATLWKPSVEDFLNQPGRTFATGMDIARACGRTYESMDIHGWRTIAKLVKESGWRSGKP